MPLKRTFRRKTFRKFPRRKKSVAGMAVTAYRMAKSIKRSQEKKYANLTYSSALATTFNTWGLHEIAQGDTASTRDGQMITIKSIHLRLAWDISGNNASGCFVRCVIVQDTQQVGDTTPATLDVFQANTWNSTYAYPNNVKRFKILWDKTFQTDPKAIAWNGTANYNLDTAVFKNKWVFPKIKNIYYNGTGALDIQKNGIFIFMAKSNASTTITPDNYAQVCFLDS